MNNIQFNDPGQNVTSRRTTAPPAARGITAFLIRHGIAKNATSASVVLVVTAIVLLIAAAWLWPRGTVSAPTAPPEPNAAGNTPPVLSE